MLKYSEFLTEAQHDPLHPDWRHRENSHEELDHEYHREYEHYTKHKFPHAFKDREDFQKKHDSAPVRHLTRSEDKHLQNASPKYHSMDQVHNDFGHRRDTHKIEHELKHGRTAHPIVLKHDKGTYLLSGNTRRTVASAHKKSLLHKVIDIRTK